MKLPTPLTRLGLTLGMLCIVAGSAIGQTSSQVYEQRQDVIVAQSHGIAVTMDVFIPLGSEPNGIGIVDVASGGWSSSRSKIRDRQQARLYAILCEHGYTVFAIRPGSLSRFSGSDMVDHVESGIRWIKQHADQWQINPRRMGLTGASAGGHLASLVALKNAGTPTEDNVAVVAVAVFFPVTDLLQWGSTPVDVMADQGMGPLVRRLAGPAGTSDRDATSVRAELVKLSPAHQVTPDAPPFLIIHGDADTSVPLQQSQRLMSELRRHGIPVQLTIKPHGEHPWLTIPDEVALLADWFDQQFARQR